MAEHTERDGIIEDSEKITLLVKYLGPGATTELFVVDLPL